jgi:hypothetical protein
MAPLGCSIALRISAFSASLRLFQSAVAVRFGLSAADGLDLHLKFCFVRAAVSCFPGLKVLRTRQGQDCPKTNHAVRFANLNSNQVPGLRIPEGSSGCGGLSRFDH